MSAGWKFEVIHKTLQEEDNQLSIDDWISYYNR